MKTTAVLKCQQFEDNRSDEIELRGSKRQRLDVCDDKEGEGWDKFETEREDIGYVPLLFVAPP